MIQATLPSSGPSGLPANIPPAVLAINLQPALVFMANTPPPPPPPGPGAHSAPPPPVPKPNSPPVNCNIVLHAFAMLHRRSNPPAGESDTVHLSASLVVDGKTFPMVTRSVGDLKDTDKWYGVNLGFNNVPISTESKITFTFAILNAGHSSDSAIQSALEQVNSGLIDTGETTAAAGGFWGLLIGGAEIALAEVLKAVESLIFANCDGLVAADRYDLTGEQVLGDSGWASTRVYPGQDSSHGCGDNSNYQVGCYVQRQDVLAHSNATLRPNQSLPPGFQIESTNHDFYLIMQTDGNLVVYSKRLPNYVLWSSNTYGQAVTECIMQTDGNLVIYNGTHPNWSSNTYGHPGATATMQDDGNLVIYTGSTVQWSSNSDIML